MTANISQLYSCNYIIGLGFGTIVGAVITSILFVAATIVIKLLAKCQQRKGLYITYKFIVLKMLFL